MSFIGVGDASHTLALAADQTIFLSAPMPYATLLAPDDKPEEALAGDDICLTELTCRGEHAPQPPVKEWTGPRCDKCQAPLTSGKVSVCRKCGWYPSLGLFVEIDPEWEIASDPEAPQAPREQKSHLQVWLHLIPRWGWIIIGSALAVVVESVFARFATEGSLRTKWSLGQLAIGELLMNGAHVLNFLSLTADDPDLGMMDLLLKPMKLWMRTCQKLPKRLSLVNAAVCGLVAVIMSLTVIGGIPYDRMWDWGFKQPPKQNLMAAVMDRAKEMDSKGADNLEDAIGDFAGKGDITGKTDQPAAPPRPHKQADCVILGYQMGSKGQLTSLVLGTVHKSRLVYAGRVTPEMPENEMNELLTKLSKITTNQPFISIAVVEAIWVKPKFTCRVRFNKQEESGRIEAPEWDSLLGTMNAGR